MPNPTKKVQIVGEVLKSFVRNDIAQELTEEQKKQARDNISAADVSVEEKVETKADKISDTEIIEMMVEEEIVDPVSNGDNVMYADNNGKIYVL